MTPEEFLEPHVACTSGHEYAMTQPDMVAVWDNCPNYEWMTWMLRRVPGIRCAPYAESLRKLLIPLFEEIVPLLPEGELRTTGEEVLAEMRHRAYDDAPVSREFAKRIDILIKFNNSIYTVPRITRVHVLAHHAALCFIRTHRLFDDGRYLFKTTDITYAVVEVLPLIAQIRNEGVTQEQKLKRSVTWTYELPELVQLLKDAWPNPFKTQDSQHAI